MCFCFVPFGIFKVTLNKTVFLLQAIFMLVIYAIFMTELLTALAGGIPVDLHPLSQTELLLTTTLTP